MAIHSVFLPEKNSMDRGAWQACPRGHKESDTTEQLNTHANTQHRASTSQMLAVIIAERLGKLVWLSKRLSMAIFLPGTERFGEEAVWFHLSAG